mgnify:CR=1 FL=1
MRPSKKHWRVEVVWDDSTVNNGRWCDIKDVLEPANRATTRIHSVGFVLADDETGVVLASGVHGNEATGITHIPRGCVRRVKRLQPIPEPACFLCRRTKDEHAARPDLLHTFTPEPAPRAVAYGSIPGSDDWVMADPEPGS